MDSLREVSPPGTKVVIFNNSQILSSSAYIYELQAEFLIILLIIPDSSENVKKTL